jgi:hypothetical protein
VESPASSPPTTVEASLTGLRIAAAIGFLGAIALVVLGFQVAWWLGLVALVMMPAPPTLGVMLVEAVRRN